MKVVLEQNGKFIAMTVMANNNNRSLNKNSDSSNDAATKKIGIIHCSGEAANNGNKVYVKAMMAMTMATAMTMALMMALMTLLQSHFCQVSNQHHQCSDTCNAIRS